ncbi:MAG: dihydrodipicolinate synthase family protein, partial [Chloroflexi bacterium]|nr:dihydrodipicolinate synthase family protein [Chloroflexota bacterium]
RLRGQWTTRVTPFTADDQVDEAALRHNVRHMRSLGTTGAGCTWGMGEFWSLTRDERMKVMDIVADEAAGQWLIGAHVTHTSHHEMLALARHAEERGFDLLIAAAPYFVTKTEEQVIDYIRILAENTSLAIMFYNSPQFGIVLSPQALKRVCAIPNVVGVKEASFNQQLSIEAHLLLGKQAIISTPDEWIFPKARQLGFQQQVMFANTSDFRFDTPGANHYVQFIDRATRGDLDQEFYDTHLKDIKALSDKWWGRTVKKFGGALPVPMVKYWGELMGLKAGSVRPPLADLTAEEKDELKAELTALRPRLAHQAASSNGQSTAAPSAISLHDRPAAATPITGNGADWLRAGSGTSGMMLLVSVQNMEEALEADRGGADIIDIKNLQEALVGSGHPLLVEEIRRRIPPEKHVSVTLGVVPNQPGTVAMAVYAAARLDATSVKVGFVNTDYETAVQTLRESRAALQGSKTKLIGSLFADNHLRDGLDPNLMVKLAKDGECDGLLIDTLTKDGRNLFDFIPEPRLKEIVLEAKQLGMSTALSGHLRMTDVDELARINPDIVGVRGAVCASGDRERAVASEAVAAFRRELELRKSGAIDPRAAARRGSGNGSDGGWIVIDGRGKNCAGVIAALAQQVERDGQSFVEAILADALNIYDVILWVEQAGHRLITQRKDQDGTVRVLIQPNAGVKTA